MNDWEHEAAEREMDVLHNQIAVLQGAYQDLGKVAIDSAGEVDVLRAKVGTLEYELSATERAVCDAITQRDALQTELHTERNQQQRTIATKCLTVMEENARLLDVLGNLLVGIETYLEEEGRAVATLKAARREVATSTPDGDVSDLPPTELVDTCAECGKALGRYRVVDNNEIVCFKCVASDHASAQSGADTPSEMQPCPLCNGAGEYANVSPCNACGGAGELTRHD